MLESEVLDSVLVLKYLELSQVFHAFSYLSSPSSLHLDQPTQTHQLLFTSVFSVYQCDPHRGPGQVVAAAH